MKTSWQEKTFRRKAFADRHRMASIARALLAGAAAKGCTCTLENVYVVDDGQGAVFTRIYHGDECVQAPKKAVYRIPALAVTLAELLGTGASTP